jgi:hypothetical protein
MRPIDDYKNGKRERKNKLTRDGRRPNIRRQLDSRNSAFLLGERIGWWCIRFVGCSGSTSNSRRHTGPVREIFFGHSHPVQSGLDDKREDAAETPIIFLRFGNEDETVFPTGIRGLVIRKTSPIWQPFHQFTRTLHEAIALHTRKRKG